jgi:hypothetical protein
MVVWTRQQQAVVAILPKISSFCSFLGSGWIAIEILSHQGHYTDIGGNTKGSNQHHSSSSSRKQLQQNRAKRHHPYHRLLLAMCLYDVTESVWNFLSTWPIPSDTPNRIWASGSRGTCSAQGFFLQVAVAIPIYNAFLAMYYMLVINFQITEVTLVRRVEPIMHIVANVLGWVTSLTMLGMGYMNDANLWCWIAAYPAGCLNTYQFGYPPENEFPCTRGNYAWIFRWSFYFAPVWLSIITASKCFCYKVYIIKSMYQYPMEQNGEKRPFVAMIEEQQI